MAKKKARRPRRPRASAPPAKRGRRMNGARRTSGRSRSRARRMNMASKADIVGTATDVMLVGGGVIGAALLIGVAKKVVENYYARTGIVAGVGIITAILAAKYPAVRKVAIGIAAGAAAGAATKALQGTSIGAAMNGARKLSNPELKAIAEGMRKGGNMSRQPNTLTGQADTMNASGMPEVLNGAYGGETQWNQLWS